jgi:hypothetical protein
MIPAGLSRAQKAGERFKLQRIMECRNTPPTLELHWSEAFRGNVHGGLKISPNPAGD